MPGRDYIPSNSKSWLSLLLLLWNMWVWNLSLTYFEASDCYYLASKLYSGAIEYLYIMISFFKWYKWIIDFFNGWHLFYGHKTK